MFSNGMGIPAFFEIVENTTAYGALRSAPQAPAVEKIDRARNIFRTMIHYERQDIPAAPSIPGERSPEE